MYWHWVGFSHRYCGKLGKLVRVGLARMLDDQVNPKRPVDLILRRGIVHLDRSLRSRIVQALGIARLGRRFGLDGRIPFRVSDALQ